MIPIRDLFEAHLTVKDLERSMSFFGGSRVVPSDFGRSGAGRARRSIFPFGVIGSASITTHALGTMYSGSF